MEEIKGEQYKGYIIKLKDFAYSIYKNGKYIAECATASECREYIDGLEK